MQSPWCQRSEVTTQNSIVNLINVSLQILTSNQQVVCVFLQKPCVNNINCNQFDIISIFFQQDIDTKLHYLKDVFLLKRRCRSCPHRLKNIYRQAIDQCSLFKMSHQSTSCTAECFYTILDLHISVHNTLCFSWFGRFELFMS